MTKNWKTYNAEKKDSSVNGAGKIGKQHTKEWNKTTICSYAQTLSQNGSKTWV